MTDEPQDDRATAKAKELIPCTIPPGQATCPFGWNRCRRSARCELIDDVAVELRKLQRKIDLLRTTFRVNVMRWAPEMSHDDITKHLDAIEREAD